MKMTVDEQTYCNRCGSGKITVRIDRVARGGTACFGPGVTKVDNRPFGGRVTNIYYLYKGC